MPKKNVRTAKGESLASSGELNVQTVTSTEMEATMAKNTKPQLAGRNIPVEVGEPEFSTRSLTIRGQEVEVRLYKSGVISIGDPKVMQKAVFGPKHVRRDGKPVTTNPFVEIRGVLNGLIAVMDNPEGEFVPGFQLACGRQAVAASFQPKKEGDQIVPSGYVNFDLLDAGVRAGFPGCKEAAEYVASFGLKPRKDNANRFLAVSASFGKLHPLYPVAIVSPDQHLKDVEKYLDEPVASFKELPLGLRRSYEKKVATYHKRFGIEAVLRMLAGNLKIILIPQNMQDWEVKKIDYSFQSLWKTTEERKEHFDAWLQNRNLQDRVRKTAAVFAQATPEEPVSVSDYIASAEEAHMVDLWTEDGVIEVPFEKLYKKNIRYVRADGSWTSPAVAWVKEDPNAVLGAMATAELFNSYIALAE